MWIFQSNHGVNALSGYALIKPNSLSISTYFYLYMDSQAFIKVVLFPFQFGSNVPTEY